MSEQFDKLVNIVKKLRGPEGCPWDRKQNLYSLKSNIIEEAYELVDALDRKDIENIKEELGDLLLHVIFHSVIAEEENLFKLTDVINGLINKLITRHPHVFGEQKIDTVEGVLINWEKIKKKEKKNSKSIVDGLPRSLPAIEKAKKIQKKASYVGFDFPNKKECLKKIDEELCELKEGINNKNRSEIFEELGDLLFSIINLSRLLDINAEEALRFANKKFMDRIRLIEDKLTKDNKSIEEIDPAERDRLWEETKSK
ncbi:MAG: nucleoside triphosphate pyrophosphohydrolase [Deferribacterota bacterium]|nr:nucleoside triphosphate pyrophosphohydrolase [Deferribacterota bacterium]